MRLNIVDVAAQAHSVVENIIHPVEIIESHFYQVNGIADSNGERKLMAAILSDGVKAYIDSFAKGDSESLANEEALSWVETRGDEYVFSFDSICETLGINPDYLRKGLRSIVEECLAQRVDSKSLGFSGTQNSWKKVRRPRVA